MRWRRLERYEPRRLKSAEPDEHGVKVCLKPCLSRYIAECADGFELDLPPDVKVIRFWNSY